MHAKRVHDHPGACRDAIASQLHVHQRLTELKREEADEKPGITTIDGSCAIKRRQQSTL